MSLLASDWTTAPMSEADHALCAYAVKLTLEPKQMTETDVITLRDFGFSDQAVHDAVQVIAYFNYINRVADGLGVELETHVRPWEKGPRTPE